MDTEAAPDAGSAAPDATPYSCDCPDAGNDDAGFGAECSESGNRVPEADDLCVGVADGDTTSGMPDEPGCPNTCNCDCYDEKCYLGGCTKIGGCGVCPVFR